MGRARRLAAAAAGVLVLVAGLAAWRAAGGEDARAVAVCRSDVRRGVLPPWARTGFSDPEPRLPHVLGRDGAIAALLFGDPLSSPPAPRRANKILWVARRSLAGPADLRITARRIVGTRAAGPPVRRTVPGGPGPSIVDVPRPGCWRLTLRWARRTDVLDLRYTDGARRPAQVTGR